MPSSPAALAAPSPPAPVQPPAGSRPPRFFRRLDWLTCALVFAATGLGYYLTLAPEVTLEDSGELATGSFYAGIPHSPGYPVWTLYTWLWTVLLPVGNIAWRVALGEAFAGALAAGILGLLVARGASLLIGSLESLKGIPEKTENTLCAVSGFVAGLLLGFNGFMWSQSVIVEVYSFGVLSLMVTLAFLLRWIYAPQRRRYLYAALFVFGLCFTNHQTLIVAAMGIEVTLAAADFRLGRSLFLGNAILYLMGWLLVAEQALPALGDNPAVYTIFHLVGLCSLAAYAGLAWVTKETRLEWGQDGFYAGGWLCLAAMPKLGWVGVLLALVAFAAFLKLTWRNPRASFEWRVVLLAGLCWVAGAAFYFYMPLASMTNPPMNWSYPRTVDGFIHAVTRGQYEQTHPTDLLNHPLIFLSQLGMLGSGLIEEFNWIGATLALVPFVFFRRVAHRERAWLGGLAAIYGCLGFLLLILLNPPPDRSAQQLHRVFFTASHTVVALLAGYGLALIAAWMAVQYARFRAWGILGGAVALGLANLAFLRLVRETYFSDGASMGPGQILRLTAACFTNRDQYALPVYAGLGLVLLAALFLGAMILRRERAPLALALALFALLPGYSVLTHWADNEQRGHWFGYWYGHDMFTPPFKGPDGKPVYHEMPRGSVLLGGTDAGRFCPTYMIFCESFLPPGSQPAEDQRFNRRDVYIITQNAIADPPYLNYIRAHYNRSAQVDPPFFQEFARLLLHDPPEATNLLARASAPLDRFFTGLGERVEKRRRSAGVYPEREIHIPTPVEASQCYEQYRVDAQRRMEHNQLEPGENVSFQGRKMTVGGQTAVMAINGLLARLVFDQNPDHDFFVEESVPIKWMAPLLTPYGLIMKLNRQPVAELGEEVVRRDHEFWARYSERLVGNWITYDTSVAELAASAERLYLRHDYTGFKGDRRFVRDDQAQKCFSKLRTAQGALYARRIHADNPAERQRMIQEAEYALRQAFAFCPYHIEAVAQYVQLLANLHRFDDALVIARTCLKLDPNNGQVTGIIKNVETWKRQEAENGPAIRRLAELEQAVRDHPENFQSRFDLAAFLLAAAQTNRALETLHAVIAHPQVNVPALQTVIQALSQVGDVPGIATTLDKLIALQPENPEAWENRAAFRVMCGQTNEALADLRRAVEFNTLRLRLAPAAHNVMDDLVKDPRLAPLRQIPEFQRLLAPGG